MSDRLSSLTEKEKETLRLMARGHDAKSAAHTIGLSVHTIHERLRNARRKLEVTSSREAARILLESEGTEASSPPENLGHISLGDASRPPKAHPSSTKAPGASRAVWIGGIAVMPVLVVTLSLALLQPATAPAEQPKDKSLTAQLSPIDATHEQVARNWLALVDKQNWRGSFDAAGEAFRNPNTVTTWRAASEQARTPLGNVVKREAIAFQNVNAPPNGYTLVRFLTSFENREAAIETVTLEREGAVFRVVAYVID